VYHGVIRDAITINLAAVLRVGPAMTKLFPLFLAVLIGALAPPPGPGGPPPHTPPGRSGMRGDRRDEHLEDMTGWQKLGEAWVNGGSDRDKIHVGRDDGRFRAIRLKAEHSALELYDLVITFGDGETFSPTTRVVFSEGQWSRVIDLPGRERVIRNIEFRYGNLPGGGKAQLEVWGR